MTRPTRSTRRDAHLQHEFSDHPAVERRRKSVVDELLEDASLAPEFEAAAAIDDAHMLLRQALERASVDQAQIATILGVSPARVTQIVHGEDDLRLSTLARYVRALGTHLGLSLYPAGPGINRPVAGLSVKSSDVDTIDQAALWDHADSEEYGAEIRLHRVVYRHKTPKTNQRQYLSKTFEISAEYEDQS